MSYRNVNQYVSRHMVFMYIVFIVTGMVFFGKFKHTVMAPPEIVVFTDTITVFVDSSKTHEMFLDAIGKRESGNKYRKVNRFGYMGKYQFGKETLKGLKIKCTAQEFLNQPDLQEFAMDEYLRLNKKKLHTYIGKHQFTYYRGVYITESGILAAAHLGGAGSVMDFFKGKPVFKDAFGTPITQYMKEFGGYNLDFK